MWRCAVIICVVGLPSSAAIGGAVIELAPVDPGPYAPGQRVEVKVSLTQEPPGEDVYLRLLRLDFADTDTSLALDDVFEFDYSGQAVCGYDPVQCGAGYAEFPVLMSFRDGNVVATVYTGAAPDPGGQIRFPGDGSVSVGSIGVTLPNVPGEYILDVLNADTVDATNLGARIDFGFGLSSSDPWVTWYAVDQNQIAGGRFAPSTTANAGFMFGYTPISGVIVPEPASLALLGLVGMAALNRRRKNTARSSLWRP